MAIQFLPMPRPGDGVSSLLDFSPLAASLQNYTRGNDIATQRANMQQVGQTFADQGASAAGKQALSMGELDTGMQLTQQASADKDRQVKVLGAVAKVAKFEQDPQRRAMLWQAGLKRAGVNPQDLDPEELDPMTGPDVFLAASGMAEDPLDRKLKEAQIQKALRPDSGPDAPNAVREYQFYQSLPEDQKRQYLAVKRAQQTLDLGTSYGIADPTSPGQLQGTVAKDIAGAEQQKIEGREAGERKMAAPKARAAMEAADAKAQVVLDTIADARKMIGASTAGLGGAVLSNIPGTAARDLSAKIDTLKANAGFAELQSMRDNSPTGGALGQVAVQELAMLQATITSLEQAQTPQQLTQAMDAYEKFIRESKVRRKLAYEMTYGQNAQTPGGSSAGEQPERAVNPQTGETVEWNGSAWVPVQ